MEAPKPTPNLGRMMDPRWYLPMKQGLPRSVASKLPRGAVRLTSGKSGSTVYRDHRGQYVPAVEVDALAQAHADAQLERGRIDGTVSNLDRARWRAGLIASARVSILAGHL